MEKYKRRTLKHYITKLVNYVVFQLIFSGSACSLSAGLESMGLADMRIIVKLMCLCAASKKDDHEVLSHQFGPALTEKLRASSQGASSDVTLSHLSYLSAAIGALAKDNPTASKLLVQLCTQVSC